MRKGILFASTSYILWGLFPLYFKALHEFAPIEILLHRMLWSLVFLSIVLSIRKQWSWLRGVMRQPRLIAGFAASALLLSGNWFIYIWSINNGRVIDSSLGYFMTPLVNVLLGFLLLQERLRPGQWLSVAIAACGVLWLTVQAGHVPWIGLSLALTFGSYGLLRKTAKLGALEGLSLETLLLFPVAAAYLALLANQGQSHFAGASTSSQLLLLAAGPITAIPLLLFAAGARRIPMSTLGLLQYISPSLQLILGVWLFKEPFNGDRLLGFIAIWAALAVYSLEGLRQSFIMAKQRG
ncbi:EamA family transporter RarD [Undibacterium sp.]|uniref:EamA family transporter RarD n=1 Tax=Undibacterium sp. TaxID=1914977 RepID=UPI002D0254D3|nr:EamA family transporter RarD [Undibacterium sp.]HTD05023.1 EamA family transporter RarD [Undibacterium sp.]